MARADPAIVALTKSASLACTGCAATALVAWTTVVVSLPGSRRIEAAELNTVRTVRMGPCRPLAAPFAARVLRTIGGLMADRVGSGSRGRFVLALGAAVAAYFARTA